MDTFSKAFIQSLLCLSKRLFNILDRYAAHASSADLSAASQGRTFSSSTSSPLSLMSYQSSDAGISPLKDRLQHPILEWRSIIKVSTTRTVPGAGVGLDRRSGRQK